MQLVREVIFTRSGLRQQAIVQFTAFRGQRHAALFNFTEARGVGAFMFTGEKHRLFEGFKAGLTQQDRHFTTRRAFDQNFRLNAVLRHQLLHPVNVQRARRKVVDMTPREADHVSNQSVLVTQRQVGLLVDRCMAVPAERFDSFLHKLMRLRFGKVTLRLMEVDKFQTARRKDVPVRENFCRSLA